MQYIKYKTILLLILCFYNVNAQNFSNKVLGYYKSGIFPFMKSLEDVEKLTNALLKEIDMLLFRGHWYTEYLDYVFDSLTIEV